MISLIMYTHARLGPLLARTSTMFVSTTCLGFACLMVTDNFRAPSRVACICDEPSHTPHTHPHSPSPKRAVKVPGQETWVAKRVSAWPARSAEATILGEERNRRGLTLWQASPSKKSGSKARLEQVLTRTQTGLTQGTKEEEEHRTGACSFGERQRWQQTGEAAQRSSSETDCRFAPVEFQQLRHALALRHALRSRLKGSARLLVGRAHAQKGWPSPPRAS